MSTASSTLCSSLQISSSLRRPRRNSKRPITSPATKKLQSDQRLNLVIDIQNIKTNASNSFNKFITTSKIKFNRYIYSANEAFDDFKTSVSVDENRRLVISCRPSSIWFLADSLIWGFLILFVFRVIIGKLGFFGHYHGGYDGKDVFFMKRDRSLGGREVVAGKRGDGKKKKGGDFRVESNPLSYSKDMLRLEKDVDLWRRKRVSSEDEFPKWWPDLVGSSKTSNIQKFQNEANRVIRAIMENRMCGRDITEDDIRQFRRICKASGAKVHIETTNARDSFYRASVDFVLNQCSSSGSISSHVQIDGEDARDFVAGLADSIGLQSVRAARIVSAAVAARTRACFLQAWAFEMQGKHTEALMELSKICLIHRVFPPNQSSPEMEMVAQGLEKHLRVEQRKHLWNLLAEVCNPPSTSTMEALGFTAKPSIINADDDRWRRIS
ncbi:hypothetical protein ACHQM5_028461 [Ranunculus cassubicifolius]